MAIIASGDWWTLDDKGLLRIFCAGDMPNYTDYSDINPTPWNKNTDQIRSVILNDGVTSIGNYAFHHCKNLTNVTIPNSVTSIGDWAFEVCSSLTSVTIPDSVTSIGGYAFYLCSSLTSITIPDGVTEIGGGAFRNCGIESITIPDSVVSIDHDAFISCLNLRSATFGSGLTWIGEEAFGWCYSLTDITFKDGSQLYMSDGAFRDCNLTNLTIPSRVANIGVDAFLYCSLADVTIENGLTEIGYRAFMSSGLKSIVIPVSVTNIGESAFIDCGKLTDVYYAGTREQWMAISINEEGNEDLLNSRIHYNVTAFYTVTFDSNGGDAVLPQKVASSETAIEEIPVYAGYDFGGWYLNGTEYDFNTPVTADITLIARWVEQTVSGTPFFVNVSYTDPGGQVLQTFFTLGVIKLQSLQITSYPSKMTYEVGETIDYTGFAVTGYYSNGAERDLTAQVTLDPPQGYLVQSTGQIVVELSYNGELWKQYDMTAIGIQELRIDSLPDKMEYEYMEALDLTGLVVTAVYTDGVERNITSMVTSVPAEGEPVTDGNIQISIGSGTSAVNVDFSVDVNTRSAVAGGDWWTLYDDGLLHIYCVGPMPNAPWNNNEYRNLITDLKIDNTVTNICAAAFSDCSNLDSVDIPDSITVIEMSAFANTGKLIGMRFPPLVTTIPLYCFESSKLELNTLAIPNTVTTIEGYAFRYCDNIKHVILPATITDLSAAQFAMMMGLEDVVFHGIQTLGGAFVECPSLKWVYLPTTIRSISLMEFYVHNYTSSFTDIYYAGSQAQWNSVSKNFILINPTVHYNSADP